MPLTIVNTDNEGDDANRRLANAWTVTTATVSGTTYVFVGGYESGLSVLRLGPGGALTPVFDQADNVETALQSLRLMRTAQIGGDVYLYATGQGESGISVFKVLASGALEFVQTVLDDASAELAGARGIAIAAIDGKTFVYVTAEYDGGISIFEAGSDGRLTAAGVVTDDDASHALQGAADPAIITLADVTFLVVPSYDEGAVSVFRLGADGSLTQTSVIRDSATTQLGGAITAETVLINGSAYVIVGSEVDGGFSIFALSASGVLSHVQSVPDSQALLVNGVGGIRAFEADGATYLAVGGAESGISIFRMAADGTVTFDTNIVDTAATFLATYAHVATAAQDGRTYLLGVGYGDGGVSAFDVGPAEILLDFNHVVYESPQGPDYNYTHSVITEDGFVIDNLRTTSANEFGNFTTDNVGWSHGPGTPYVTYGPSSFRVSRADGQAFDFHSAKFDTRKDFPGSVTVTGTRADGSTVSTTVALDTIKSLQLFSFTGFTNLIQVDFSGPANFMFDDIQVGAATNTDTAAAANDDAAATSESAPVSDNVFDDNGSGADTDAEGNPFSVTAVNGDSTKVGQQVTLPSGALLTLNADGSYTYDPNGAFDYLITAAEAAATGAVNSTATDSFTYTITGGDSATVTITITGEESAGDELRGDGTDNVITGTVSDDIVRGLGGNDTLDGGGGADKLYGGDGDDVLKVTGGTTGADTPQEEAHGGAGSDHLILDYSALTEQLGLYVRGPDGQGFEGFVDIPDGTNRLYFTGIDRLTITSGSGNDIITGIGGDDVMNGNDGNDVLLGRGGDDLLNGGGGNDRLHADEGADTLIGGAGRDILYFGAHFGAGDTVDGGGNADIVILQGDYSATTSLDGITNLGNLGSISLFSNTNTLYGGQDGTPNSYDLVAVDSNVGAGEILKINGSSLAASEDLTFDGSAELDGSFWIYAGKGTDTLTGGAKNDTFIFGPDGRFAAGDSIDGAAGYDVMVLRGDYVLNLLDGAYAGAFTGIESIALVSAADTTYGSGGGSDFDYEILFGDDHLAAGAVLAVNGSRLGANETMYFDGALESDGHFRLWGGAADDFLAGGAGNDLIYGGLGADDLIGGGGADTFRYQSTAESTLGAADMITGFQAGIDKIDLSRIDANVHAEGDQAFRWVGLGAFSGQGAASAGELRMVAGSAGEWRIEGDTDGDGVADLVIDFNATPIITFGDFIP